MKKCNKCDIEKPFEEFVKNKYSKDGITGTCKICASKIQKEYKKNNKEKVRESQKKYRENNKKRYQNYKESQKEYREKNKEKIREKKKEYREKNKEKLKEKNKKYRENNKEKIREYNKEYFKEYNKENNEKRKEWRIQNKEHLKKYSTKYNKENNEKNKEWRRLYDKERKNIDPIYKLICNLRNNICVAFKRGCNNQFRKNAKTETILGCTFQEFRLHIEKQFKEGMTFENYGKWHLDHIYPVSFAKDEKHLIELNHYTNFQPLWAQENLKKSNKILPSN
jgi:DNA mismatch repair ATPase MutL